MTSFNTFLYFAYGSNLLTQRIHIANPSAIRRTIGKLPDYRLDFNYYSQRWKGCAATIVPDTSSHVWGAVWEMERPDMLSLDRQEGVHNGVYRVIEVKVITPEGKRLQCRSYELSKQPPPPSNGELLPKSRYPSKIYLDTIIAGAFESQMPEEYINYLKKFPHNGFEGPIDYDLDLKNFLR